MVRFSLTVKLLVVKLNSIPCGGGLAVRVQDVRQWG